MEFRRKVDKLVSAIGVTAISVLFPLPYVVHSR